MFRSLRHLNRLKLKGREGECEEEVNSSHTNYPPEFKLFETWKMAQAEAVSLGVSFRFTLQGDRR